MAPQCLCSAAACSGRVVSVIVDARPERQRDIYLRTVAFYFSTQAAAEAAQIQLDERITQHLAIEVAPLVVEGQDGTILALNVHDRDHASLVQIAERLGGRIVADVNEELTRPRTPPS